MEYLFLLGGYLLATLFGLMVIPKILLISYKKRLFDQPDVRKVHHVPVPRLGGLSFFPVILITMCLILGIRFTMGFPIENLPVVPIANTQQVVGVRSDVQGFTPTPAASHFYDKVYFGTAEGTTAE